MQTFIMVAMGILCIVWAIVVMIRLGRIAACLEKQERRQEQADDATLRQYRANREIAA